MWAQGSYQSRTSNAKTLPSDTPNVKEGIGLLEGFAARKEPPTGPLRQGTATEHGIVRDSDLLEEL